MASATVSNSAQPSCIGYYGFPVFPNGPCEKCQFSRLCRYLRENFVPKTKLQPILSKIEQIELMLKQYGR